MGLSRPEYWRVLTCPPLGDLPNPGIKPMSLKSPALAGRFFTTSTIWEAHLKMSPLIFWYLGENNSWVASVKVIPSYVFSPDKHKQFRKWNVHVCVFLAKRMSSLGKKVSDASSTRLMEFIRIEMIMVIRMAEEFCPLWYNSLQKAKDKLWKWSLDGEPIFTEEFSAIKWLLCTSQLNISPKL